ncbi:hypothetical protein [Roseivirga pacifica]|uniref:hypothetical protein n=1 Tax=Roseivirga pacifica TaxID=1267423 RepID=UPI00227BBFE7|nr:hypothetical protein [Roseivirga pacifica]
MKIKTTKRISIWVVATIIGFTATLSAQQAVTVEGYALDAFGRQTQDLSELPKMERDIVILKNVLNELFAEGESFIYRRDGVNGIYIPGRGVIFNISTYNQFGGVLFPSNDATAVIVNGEKEEGDVDVEQLNKKRKDKLNKTATEFLLNYGSLLSELKPNERIMLNVDYTEMQNLEKVKSSGQGVLYARVLNRNAGKKRMSSSISYSDLEAFVDGDINQSAAEGKISQKIVDLDEETTPDAKIMAGILDDLFQSSLDGKLKRRSRTSYSYFEGFGLMFDMKMSSTNGRSSVIFVERADLAITRADAKDDDAEAKADDYYKQLEEDFPAFETMVKESILEYGRTLRSVKPNEVVVVNIDLGTSYRKTKLPRSLQLMVPKSTITAYAKGNKSLEDAKKEIDIKKLTSSTSSTEMGFGTIEYVAPDAPKATPSRGYGATVIQGQGKRN